MSLMEEYASKRYIEAGPKNWSVSRSIAALRSFANESSTRGDVHHILKRVDNLWPPHSKDQCCSVMRIGDREANVLPLTR